MQKLLLYVAILATTFTACQKEQSAEIPDNTGNGGGTSNGSEIGTWKFIGIHASSSSTVESTMLGMSLKTVTLTEYDSEDNKGTMTFDGKKITVTDLGYTMNTTATVYMYLDGSLDDSLAVPLSYTLPPTNQSADYKKIGTDSLYLPSGAMTMTNSGQIQGMPAGYKLKWDGDKMIMTLKFEETKNAVVQGIPTKTINKGTTVTTLQKQ